MRTGGKRTIESDDAEKNLKTYELILSQQLKRTQATKCKRLVKKSKVASLFG